jgi:hypothetical protein
MVPAKSLCVARTRISSKHDQMFSVYQRNTSTRVQSRVRCTLLMGRLVVASKRSALGAHSSSLNQRKEVRVRAKTRPGL